MNQSMKKCNPAKALLFLLIIPAQLILGILFVLLGVYVDSQVLFSNAGSAQGHPFPAFSLVFSLIAAVVTIIAIIAAVILTITSFIRISKNNAQTDDT